MPACCDRKNWFVCSGLLAVAFATACASIDSSKAVHQESVNQKEDVAVSQETETGTATFGGGCFWCVEAVFQELDGVTAVNSGYMGGHVDNPTYRQVCNGTTGHAEVCQIKFDPEKVNFEKLLEVFWATHDPTTLNRQGADAGTQYRSVVFFHSDQQKAIAEQYRKRLDESGAFNNPIVTEITAASKYYAAEDYHQDYFSLNPRQPYCQGVIVPKMAKFRKVFADSLKTR